MDYEKINDGFRNLLFIAGVPQWGECDRIPIYKSHKNGEDIHFDDKLDKQIKDKKRRTYAC